MTPPYQRGCRIYYPLHQRGCGIYDPLIRGVWNLCPLPSLYIDKIMAINDFIRGNRLGIYDPPYQMGCCVESMTPYRRVFGIYHPPTY